MKTKYQARRQATDAQDSALGQRRMYEYLKATHAEFEAAVERASTLGQAATGVLAGPRIRVKRPDEYPAARDVSF